MIRSGTLTANLLAYGCTHALVDATCAALVFSLLKTDQLEIRAFFYLVILYDTLAFALQSPFGIMVDRWRWPKLFAIAGCILTAAALPCWRMPYLAVGLAGVGNALFHIGGGVVSLNLLPRKAAFPGLFVAPGALGLCFGTLIGKGGHFTAWPFALLLLMAITVIALLRHPAIDYETEPTGRYDHAALIILLLLLSIAIRSLVGLALDLPWKANISLLLLLTSAVFLGKALGGIIGDRLGWLRTAISGLILSAPLLAFGSARPALAILGVFLFNLTMPVTLVAIANMLPGRAGLAFGLTTLALLFGAYPTFTAWQLQLNAPWTILALIVISGMALFTGLKLYDEFLSRRDGIKTPVLAVEGSSCADCQDSM